MKHIAVLILALLLISPVLAVPVTNPATLVGTNNASVSAGGATSPCWFVWGQASNGETWKTPNQSAVAGACSYRIHGSPLLPNVLFYYKGCDATGCGNELSFTTAQITPMPTTTFGATFDNLTENGMDITLLGSQTMTPYTWLVPDFVVIVWGLVISFIILGMWLRGRDVTVPTIIGVFMFTYVANSSYGLNIGLPLEITSLGMGIAFAAIAGIILAVIKK